MVAGGLASFFASLTGPDGPNMIRVRLEANEGQMIGNMTVGAHMCGREGLPGDIPLGWVKSPFSTPVLRALLNMESNW